MPSGVGKAVKGFVQRAPSVCVRVIEERACGAPVVVIKHDQFPILVRPLTPVSHSEPGRNRSGTFQR